MMPKRILISFFLVLFNSALITSHTYALKEGSSGEVSVYDLNTLYQRALKYSDEISLSEENRYQAQLLRQKAMGALVPRIDAFGRHTKYSERKDLPFQPDSLSVWGVEASQSVTLNGREFSAFKVAGYQKKSSDYELSSIREETLFAVASAYYDVLTAIRGEEIARASVSRLEAHRNAVKTRLGVEAVLKTDLYRSESELSEARANLIQSVNRTQLLKARLASLASIDHTFSVEMPRIRSGNGHNLNLDDLKKQAVSQRSEMKALQAQKLAADKSIRVAKGEYWPKLSLTGSYSNQEMSPEMEEASYESLSVTAAVSVPLFDGGLKRADVAEYRSRSRQAEMRIRAKAKEISLEVESAYLNVRNQNSILSSLKDRFEFAKENYTAVMRQFKSGIANSLELMDANTQLVESEELLAEATFGLDLAYLRLERVKGELLSRVEADLGRM